MSWLAGVGEALGQKKGLTQAKSAEDAGGPDADQNAANQIISHASPPKTMPGFGAQAPSVPSDGTGPTNMSYQDYLDQILKR